MKKEIKNLLKAKNILPKKRLGQNFLISEKVLEKIIAAAQLKPEDTILEIGPGIGILTKEIAQKAKKVIAVEKDLRMIDILKENLKDFQNVEIINEDILKLREEQWPQENYKLVANLPYYITAPVIRMFLESAHPPKLMVLMVQKEVGQRICAKPPRMSKLAVFCQFFGKPEIIDIVSKKSFWPQPKVDSAIIKIVPHQSPLSSQLHQRFIKIVKAGFSHPRKQLVKNLFLNLNLSRQSVERWLLKNNIQPSQRAETLSLNDWLNLTLHS